MDIKCLLILLIVSVSPCVGQKQLFVVPSLGIHMPTCHTIEGRNSDSKASANTFPVGPSFSILLRYDFRNADALSIGWRAAGDAGVSLGYGDLDRNLVRGRLGIANHVNRFVTQFEKKLRVVKALPIKRREQILKNIDYPKEDLKYLLLFQWNLLAGVSLNRVTPATGDGEIASFSNGTYIHDVTNRNNGSLLIGTSIQFLNYNKKHFILKLFYSQGIGRVIENEIAYNLQSGQYDIKLGSRGSFIGAELGYPINLIKL